MVGRIQTYTHSDSITQNKGGALVKIVCDTDFCAKTMQFVYFAERVAKLAYGANQTSWSEVIAIFPDIETDRQELSKRMKEKIEITEIVILNL